jgi:hypothetical protein
MIPKPQYSPTYIASKKTMLGKAYGTSWLILGTCWGTHRELAEHVENLVGTH